VALVPRLPAPGVDEDEPRLAVQRGVCTSATSVKKVRRARKNAAASAGEAGGVARTGDVMIRTLGGPRPARK
jgi:hypothetical protein